MCTTHGVRRLISIRYHNLNCSSIVYNTWWPNISCNPAAWRTGVRTQAWPIFFLYIIFSSLSFSLPISKIYKYATFYQTIRCGSRIMNIFTKFLDRPKFCSAKPRHHFAYQWLDNVEMNKYAKFYPNIPCGYEPAEMMLSKPSPIKKGCCTCQWLDNVNMHLFKSCKHLYYM